MPQLSLIIGLIGVAVLSWLILVLVVVRLQPGDPGEPIRVDEGVPPGYSLADSGDGGQAYYDGS